MVDLGGCTDIADQTITRPQPITVVPSVTPITAQGVNDGRITLSVTGGNPNPNGTPKYRVTWTSSVSGFDASNFENSLELTKLAPGEYSYEINDYANTGCAPATGTVTVPDDGLFFQYVASNNFCFNGANGQIAISITNGAAPYSIQLSGKTNQTLSGLDGRDIYYFENLQNDNYYVTVTDGNGTKVVKRIEVKNEGKELHVALKSSSIDCFELNSGEVVYTVDGGVANSSGFYSYTVRLEGVNQTQENASVTELSDDVDRTFTGVPAGTYRLHIIDNNAAPLVCEAYSDEFTLVQSSISLTTSATDVLCANGSDGSISATVTGGSNLTYDWSYFPNKSDAEAALAAKTNTQKLYGASSKSGVPTGFYYVAVTDANVDANCTLFGDIVEVSEPAELKLSSNAITVTSCDNTVANGQITVRAEGGTAPYTFTLDGANTISSETGDHNFTGLLTGNHTISLYDANGCTFSGNPALVYVPIYEKVEMSVSDYVMDDSENGTGTATVKIKGGVASSDNYTYEVTLSGATSGTAKNVHISTADSNLPTGVVINKDASGKIESVDVKFDGLAADTYLVTVRDAHAASNSCSASASFTLNKLAITATQTDPDCSTLMNGSINVSVTGANGFLTYEWYLGDAKISEGTSLITGLDAGTYKLRVTDVQGTGSVNSAPHKTNYLEKTFSLTNKRTLSIVLPQDVDEKCYNANDGEISIVVQGADENKSLSYK